MLQHLVLTVLAEDKPGIVETVAATIARHGASWQQSSMSQLAGKFAGILLIAVADTEVSPLTEDLEALIGEGLRINLEPTDCMPKPRIRTLLLTLVGNDRPGIVGEISAALATREVNVEKLETRCETAPMSGGTLFHLRANLEVPSELSEQTLNECLESLSADFMIELHAAEQS